MCNASHGKGDVDIQKSEGGGLFSVENCVLIDRNRLCEYARAKPEPVVKGLKEKRSQSRGETGKPSERVGKANWKTEAFTAYSLVKLNSRKRVIGTGWNVATWKGLQRCGTLLAAQEQAIRTSAIKHQVDRENISTFSRLCGERGDYVETIAHLISVYKPCIETVQILGTWQDIIGTALATLSEVQTRTCKKVVWTLTCCCCWKWQGEGFLGHEDPNWQIFWTLYARYMYLRKKFMFVKSCMFHVHLTPGSLRRNRKKSWSIPKPVMGNTEDMCW